MTHFSPIAGHYIIFMDVEKRKEMSRRRRRKNLYLQPCTLRHISRAYKLSSLGPNQDWLAIVTKKDSIQKYIVTWPLAHNTTLEFSLLAHILQMLLASKINSHISSNFCPDHQDGSWIIKALNATWYKILWVIRLAPMWTWLIPK